ncbi:hypothetical protein C8F01DRAFT_389426 [Mycena amicta]|nr:hypothetical protein C8F01DRAFT_389426 [Mycena amicta]
MWPCMIFIVFGSQGTSAILSGLDLRVGLAMNTQACPPASNDQQFLVLMTRHCQPASVVDAAVATEKGLSTMYVMLSKAL